MSDKQFLDTNLLIYAFAQGDSRTSVAERLLAAGGVVSVQVLNEFCAVARRKLGMSWDETRTALGAIRILCRTTVPLSVALHESALGIGERHGYSIYDALIIAAALEAGCTILYSEDMQGGQTIERLTIRNPFEA